MQLFKNNDNPVNEKKIIDQIRCLGIDMVQEAKSGHPGVVLGAAPILYTLYANHLRINPTNPDFFNRDRFVLSPGHASALLYATLFMSGYNLDIEDLKKFRQINSITPGHPELKTPGVDVATGMLGQGFANAVGMAIAEAHLESLINKNDKIVDFNTYCFVSDGDLMEGISSEAASLAGTLKLNKLIVLYDSNNVTLDGNSNLSFTENIRESYEAKGWNAILVNDANNLDSLNAAINDAKKSDKPTIIEVKTTIGEYSKNQGTNIVHGKPLEIDDVSEIKNKLNMRDIPFMVTTDTIEDMQYLITERCHNLEDDFNKNIEKLEEEDKKILNMIINKEYAISSSKLDFMLEDGEALRTTSGKVLNAFYEKSKILFGGSADLFSSCKNYIEEQGEFSKDNYSSPNIYFGVREHAMAAILNGLALIGFRPYGSTFLVFSDYMLPSIRMACIMNLPIIYIFTHDSILIGEDGITHQAVEQISHLRDIPNLDVYRPTDANEVLGSYKAIMEKNSGPSAIILSRNELPILEETKINDVKLGGYIAKHEKMRLDGIVISSGEELHNVIKVVDNLFTKGIDLRVVSMPNIKKFLEQSEEYIDQILPVEVRKIVVELSNSTAWKNIVYNDKYLILQKEFGISGRKEDIEEKFGFSVEKLEEQIESLLT